ncbi:hypothetical protein BB559_006226 [Furculomyces boomerangus]|uniref:Stress response protein NST1 n=1 Tax=Furculomyces boomerangus TaxID=61424 RepID=A0A2T9Y451_9FUNG|nr:hypothetical protein BB559_006226 [Furculomyces boomerangus]
MDPKDDVSVANPDQDLTSDPLIRYKDEINFIKANLIKEIKTKAMEIKSLDTEESNNLYGSKDNKELSFKALDELVEKIEKDLETSTTDEKKDTDKQEPAENSSDKMFTVLLDEMQGQIGTFPSSSAQSKIMKQIEKFHKGGLSLNIFENNEQDIEKMLTDKTEANLFRNFLDASKHLRKTISNDLKSEFKSPYMVDPNFLFPHFFGDFTRKINEMSLIYDNSLYSENVKILEHLISKRVNGAVKEDLWNTDGETERSQILEYWLGMTKTERQMFLNQEKNSFVTQIYTVRGITCSCSNCEKKKTGIQIEVDYLYDQYFWKIEDRVQKELSRRKTVDLEIDARRYLSEAINSLSNVTPLENSLVDELYLNLQNKISTLLGVLHNNESGSGIYLTMDGSSYKVNFEENATGTNDVGNTADKDKGANKNIKDEKTSGISKYDQNLKSKMESTDEKNKNAFLKAFSLIEEALNSIKSWCVKVQNFKIVHKSKPNSDLSCLYRADDISKIFGLGIDYRFGYGEIKDYARKLMELIEEVADFKIKQKNNPESENSFLLPSDYHKKVRKGVEASNKNQTGDGKNVADEKGSKNHDSDDILCKEYIKKLNTGSYISALDKLNIIEDEDEDYSCGCGNIMNSHMGQEDSNASYEDHMSYSKSAFESKMNSDRIAELVAESKKRSAMLHNKNTHKEHSSHDLANKEASVNNGNEYTDAGTLKKTAVDQQAENNEQKVNATGDNTQQKETSTSDTDDEANVAHNSTPDNDDQDDQDYKYINEEDTLRRIKITQDGDNDIDEALTDEHSNTFGNTSVHSDDNNSDKEITSNEVYSLPKEYSENTLTRNKPNPVQIDTPLPEKMADMSYINTSANLYKPVDKILDVKSGPQPALDKNQNGQTRYLISSEINQTPFILNEIKQERIGLSNQNNYSSPLGSGKLENILNFQSKLLPNNYLEQNLPNFYENSNIKRDIPKPVIANNKTPLQPDVPMGYYNSIAENNRLHPPAFTNTLDSNYHTAGYNSIFNQQYQKNLDFKTNQNIQNPTLSQHRLDDFKTPNYEVAPSELNFNQFGNPSNIAKPKTNLFQNPLLPNKNVYQRQFNEVPLSPFSDIKVLERYYTRIKTAYFVLENTRVQKAPLVFDVFSNKSTMSSTGQPNNYLNPPLASSSVDQSNRLQFQKARDILFLCSQTDSSIHLEDERQVLDICSYAALNNLDHQGWFVIDVPVEKLKYVFSLKGRQSTISNQIPVSSPEIKRNQPQFDHTQGLPINTGNIGNSGMGNERMKNLNSIRENTFFDENHLISSQAASHGPNYYMNQSSRFDEYSPYGDGGFIQQNSRASTLSQQKPQDPWRSMNFYRDNASSSGLTHFSQNSGVGGLSPLHSDSLYSFLDQDNTKSYDRSLGPMNMNQIHRNTEPDTSFGNNLGYNNNERF